MRIAPKSELPRHLPRLTHDLSVGLGYGLESGISKAAGDVAILLLVEDTQRQREVEIRSPDVRLLCSCLVDEEQWNNATDDHDLVQEISELHCHKQQAGLHEVDRVLGIVVFGSVLLSHRAPP